METLKEHCITMANYHKWAYERLFESINPISDNDCKKDLQLFFRSIHGTLNHLCLVDKLWYGRFIDHVFGVTGLDQELYENRQMLAKAILEQADLWIGFVKSIPLEKFRGHLSYTNTKGIKTKTRFVGVLYHVFNHGTHHRGQISTVITQLGYETPVMDLLYFKPATEVIL